VSWFVVDGVNAWAALFRGTHFCRWLRRLVDFLEDLIWQGGTVVRAGGVFACSCSAAGTGVVVDFQQSRHQTRPLPRS